MTPQARCTRNGAPGLGRLRGACSRRSDPATDMELVTAVRASEVLGQVSLLAVNHHGAHDDDDLRQQQRPLAVAEQSAPDVGDRVGEVDRIAAEPEWPGTDEGRNLYQGITVVFARFMLRNGQIIKAMPLTIRAS